MQTIHKPPGMQQHMMPGGAASPAADGQPGNRMAQGKPIGMMPPPPPSPATAAKNPPGAPKQEDGGAPPNGRIDASPQNAAVGIGGQPPSGPGGPRPAGAPTTAPLTPPASARTAPSTSVNLNGSTPNMANHPPPPVPATNGLDATSFGIDFSAGLDFDPWMFNGESLNFERDFAAWFDPENA